VLGAIFSPFSLNGDKYEIALSVVFFCQAPKHEARQNMVWFAPEGLQIPTHAGSMESIGFSSLKIAVIRAMDVELQRVLGGWGELQRIAKDTRGPEHVWLWLERYGGGGKWRSTNFDVTGG